MPAATCRIEVTHTDCFLYKLADCGLNWQVASDGTITPPSRTRVIEFDIPAASDFEITGFQIFLTKQEGPEFPDDAFHNEAGAQVSIQRMPKTLTLNLQTQVTSLWYRLGLSKGGSTIWDDPKIYNEPDESP